MNKIWRDIVMALGVNLNISSMHDISSLWNDFRKNNNLNTIFAAVLRTIWITRNDFVFNRSQWCGMQGMWNRLTYSCAQWKVLLKEEGKGELTTMVSKVEEVARLPLLLLWPEPG
jgi:hypothetical protein